MAELELEGIGIVEIDDSFKNLSPDQQDAYVQNIVGQMQTPTQDSSDDSLLTKTGRFLGQAGPALGELAVGGVQAGAELLGQEEFAGRLGEQVAKRREGLLPEEQLGRAVFKTAPFLPVGATMGAVRGGMAAGAAMGAIEPTEEGTLEERLKQTATSAAIGGVAGAAFKGLSEAGKGLYRGTKRLFTAVKPEQILARRLPAGQTAELLEQLKTATTDSPVLLPDIAGDEVRGLTSAVSRLKGGRDIVRDVLEERSEKAVTRVSNALAKDISPVESYFSNLDDLAKARSEIAAPIYEKAFAKGTKLNISNNKKLFEKIAPDLKDARNKFRLDDDLPDNGIIMLDAAKKSLDDKIGKAIRQGERQEAKALLDIKKELVNKLDELNPDYKKAREVFSDFTAIENAQIQGLDFSRLRPEELRRVMRNLTVSEKEAFRIGVRENLQKTVSGTAEGADPAKRIFGNDFKKDQLRAIFPDEGKYRAFEKKMRQEIEAAKTKFRVLGSSMTREKQIDDAQFLKTVANAGKTIVTAGKSDLISAAKNAISNKFGGISEKNAKQLATILVNRGRSIEALEKIAAKEKNQLQKRLINDFISSIRPEVITTGQIVQE